MNPLPNQRSRRRTAFAMLALWLFALSAAWAHACLLQQRGTHAHGASNSATDVVVLAGHIGADSAHDDEGSGAGPADKACLKACDDGTQAVVKLPSSFDPADVAMAPPVATIWVSQVAALAPAPWELGAAAPPGVGPPLRTRYSRLVL
jgi:hypothetical protein